MKARRRCLVLGSKQALDRIAPVLDQVLESLDLDRAPAPSLDEVRRGVVTADLILAEVTKPPPSIVFELGAATALRIPVVYLAAEGTTPSPVFGQCFPYDAAMPPARLTFTLAKHVEKVLDGSAPATFLLDEPWVPAYEVGERLWVVAAYVERQGGYVLANAYGRPTGMLHVTRMTRPRASAFEQGTFAEGAMVGVEVTEVDRRRRTVQFRELGPDEPVARDNHDNDLVARLYRKSAEIERLAARAAHESPDAVAYLDEVDDRISRIRKVRNSVAHGADVLWQEVADAAGDALVIASRLEDLF